MTTKKKSKRAQDRSDDESSRSDSEKDENDGDDDQKSSELMFYGYKPFKLWRVGFYLLMAYHWSNNYHGPWHADDMWASVTNFLHLEPIYDLAAPKTQDDLIRLRVMGIVVALLSTFHDGSTILFALLAGQHIGTSIALFINHDYLFFLIATLMAIKCNGFKGDDKESTVSRNAGWIHALRGQIVVVYFFASLWKLDSDWLSGQICKGIFMTFEEQGVSRGVPWKQIYSRFPGVFRFVGLSGLALDFSLFCVMAFLPPGHFLHSITFIFHGFTGYTMSQRIGYSFPIAMILTGLLFMRQDCIHEDQQSVGGDNLSHYQWLQWQLGLGKNNKKQQKEERTRQRRRNLGPLLFLLVQWLIPLRMPLVSNGEFKQTFEGYRWSWTMMLHMKKSMQSPGLFFMTLTPDCEGMPPFPNPFAQQNIFLDVHSVSYEPLVAQKARTAALLQMFPRQMPRVAHSVNKNILGPQSCQGKPLSIRASYFSSTNDGPFHRIIDPTVDLLDVHQAQSSLPWWSKLWLAMKDKAPSEKEFILRGSGSLPISMDDLDRDQKNEVYIVDRAACLQVDPIRIHSNSFHIEFDSSSKTNFRLYLKGCSGLDRETQCKTVYIQKGEKLAIPAMRTISIGIDEQKNLGSTKCSDTIQEDVLIKLSKIMTAGAQPNPNQRKQPREL